jgi:hypothetical protein
MTLSSSASRLMRISLAGALALGLATLSGCGIGSPDITASPMVVPAFSGKAIGGQIPIAGATVKAYATTSTGYGTATMLQEATQQGSSLGQDSDGNGSFSFAGGYTCPAGQFIYLVTSGGNTGANAVNPNSVLVAALGRCEDLFTNTSGGPFDGGFVYINELTTVAAAYALGNFSAVTGTGAATVVKIGAPATNNATQVSGVSTGCVANGTTCTTTAAAGLAHAFLNATNLVNPFVNTSLTGANINLPGNRAAVVPRELIDTIANILVACVNSTGGTAGDGTTACGTIFGATTIGTNIPVNTFSAMVNLAANPTLAGSATAVGNLFNVATAQTNVYSPSLTSSTGLNDYSIAINYPIGLGASTAAAPLTTCAANPCQGLVFPTSGALDINDVYYVANSNGASGTTPVNLFAFSSAGTFLSNTTNQAGVHAYGLSVDALGNGYFGNGSSSGTNAIAIFTTGGGSLPAVGYTAPLKTVGGALHVYSTAVDQHNNVWAAGTAASASSLWMSPAGGTTWTSEGTFDYTAVTSNAQGLGIDPNQNVWVAGGTGGIAVLPNTGSVATPAYAAVQLTAAPGGTVPSAIAFIAGTGGLPSAYNAFYEGTGSVNGIQPYTPTYGGGSGATVTALGQGVITTVPDASASPVITGVEFSAQGDGAGHVWLADTNSHSVIQFTPNATPANDTAYRYEPCLFVSSTGGCFTGTSTQSSVFTTGKPFTVSVDSTGSIWVTAEAAGSIVQIIGAAAPTWPLLSLGKVGMP